MPTVYKRPRRDTDHHELRAAIQRLLRAYGRRVAQADLSDFRELVALRDDLDLAIYEAVTGIKRSTGFTWQDIGDELGVSKQAAQQRYGPRSHLARQAKARAAERARLSKAV